MTVTPIERNIVKPVLTPNRRSGRVVENDQYAAFARRVIRAHASRVSAGDVEALPDLIDLAAVLDLHIHAAVIGLRRFGYSWTEIAARIGITRQAAQQRWGGDIP